jgi:hypothetical protein
MSDRSNGLRAHTLVSRGGNDEGAGSKGSLRDLFEDRRK